MAVHLLLWFSRTGVLWRVGGGGSCFLDCVDTVSRWESYEVKSEARKRVVFLSVRFQVTQWVASARYK